MSPLPPIVECRLCPRRCKLAENERGDCRVRVNLDGELRTLVYGKPCALHIDPVEKKPLFHFLPGSSIFSIATAGCNLHCLFCQNWNISQSDPEETRNESFPPEHIVDAALKNRCPSIAYTYTEPVIYYEYTYDTCLQAHQKGLRNVLVTAWYIEEEPATEMAKVVDAANVDIKSFDDRFYRELCGGSLRPVLRATEILSKAGVLVEITNLIVPTKNDDPGVICELCAWVHDHLGAETPIHFTRFHPDYRLTGIPSTPAKTLLMAAETAHIQGLHHVYVGNLPEGGNEDTFCSKCGKKLIARRGFRVNENRLVAGRCPDCLQPLHGIWK